MANRPVAFGIDEPGARGGLIGIRYGLAQTGPGSYLIDPFAKVGGSCFAGSFDQDIPFSITFDGGPYFSRASFSLRGASTPLRQVLMVVARQILADVMIVDRKLQTSASR